MDEGAIEVGTRDEAAAAVARLLAVTEATYERRAQLQHALESRIAIEQAKGVLAERHGLGIEEAFAVIRRAARANRHWAQYQRNEHGKGDPMAPTLAMVSRCVWIAPGPGATPCCRDRSGPGTGSR